MSTEYDAVVVGAGPNGLVAAIRLAQTGRRVLVVEAADVPGGGLRSASLTGPGTTHDVCSAVHPLAVASAAFRALPTEAHGVEWIFPEAALAHPFDEGGAAMLWRSVDASAATLGTDAAAYRRLMAPLVANGLDLADQLLEPLRIPPRHPLVAARFGRLGTRSAQHLVGRFGQDRARGLLAGLAAHSMLPMHAPATAGYGLFLGALAHIVGWPIARGGSQRIADALTSMLRAHGGELITGTRVTKLTELPQAPVTLLDVGPPQVIDIAGDVLPPRYRARLGRFRYGPGAFKLDWRLDGPIPWRAPECASAGTVHLGATFEEIARAEDDVHRRRHADRPLVLLVQPTLFDGSRAPAGVQLAWGYCHVPNGSSTDMTDRIEAQVERFAPGFRDRIVGRHAMAPADLEAHDANYVGGDINGGLGGLRQLFARPVPSLHPWVTPVPGLYLCSASTPPGGGVHGMCGWSAAGEVIRRGR